MKFNLKLIIMLLLTAISGGLISGIITKEIFKEESLLPLELSLPLSFSQRMVVEFISGLYDEDKKEFKIEKDFQTSLESTYYALMAIKNLKTGLPKKIDINGVFNKIRMYHSVAGYYLEKDRDPLISTARALEIDAHYLPALNQEIDLNWLEINSLENKELEQNKFDPQYQYHVLAIYKYLNQEEIKMKTTPLYVRYYCNYGFNDISSEDYLRKKYYQISIISYLTGVKTISNSCLKKEDVEVDKNKLAEIHFKDLNDIKKVFWLYSLKNFYNVKFDPKEAFMKIEEFYSEGGFKEKLNDKKPNLIGVFYGTLFHQLYFRGYQQL